MKLSVRPVTSLAKSASAAPGQPAAYAERYAYTDSYLHMWRGRLA